MSSEKYGIHGIIGEILFLDDGSAVSLDYKFAKYKGRLFKIYKYQAVMYSMLIENNYKIEVKAYLVYTRSSNKFAVVAEEIRELASEIAKTIKV
ncbi:hypothetical protein MWH25_09085 [Natroniella acetigena]|uniref:hypothetical protein n=1 Tax=Natroniella acetigena TaxID=52004 RepID=UPI00200AFF2E|nr:hypothetical protein [Natroniella acetigena]MCK8827891.1 hypothetical protein [Natroniella acetigena]